MKSDVDYNPHDDLLFVIWSLSSLCVTKNKNFGLVRLTAEMASKLRNLRGVTLTGLLKKGEISSDLLPTSEMTFSEEIKNDSFFQDGRKSQKRWDQVSWHSSESA